MFLYIGVMDWGGGHGHLTVMVGTGGRVIFQRKLPAGPGSGPGGMLAAGIDSHIISV